MAALVSTLSNPSLTLDELVELGAVDSVFFSKTFFPKMIRQHTPDFHRDIWGKLDGPSRLVSIQVFRGGAKTSLLRSYTAKRIAYGLAHTILYIGKSEGHAIRSVKWIRRQVEQQNLWAQTFDLKKGNKWQDTECEIIHGVDEYPIWIMAMGITGSVRGINQDDFRPDLIVIDDVIDEENSATVEQRKKISDLIYGALKESLAPASETPDAKMVMLQTPLNREDASTLSLNDDEWDSAVFGVWTPETADMPVDRQESIWPERWPSETLRAEKRAATKRNQLSLWTREKECRLTSPETATFVESWLQFYDLAPARHEMDVIIGIDPVPPPTDIQIAKGLKGKDFEAFSVVGRARDRYFLLEYALNRGHTPKWTIAEFFRLCLKWRPRKVCVETVAYQKTLSWLLKEAMKEQRRFFVIEEVNDRRAKYDKISDGIAPIASNECLYVLPSMVDFQQQFRDYPDVSNDDLLDATAMALSRLQELDFMDDDDYANEETILQAEEAKIPALSGRRGAP